MTAREAQDPLLNKWIMLIDEQPANLFFTNKLLLNLGFRNVYACESGLMAMKMNIKYPCDLVLTSCQMHDMNIAEICRSIRGMEKERGTHTPVIAMTSDPLEEAHKKYSAMGVDDCIGKPLTAGSAGVILRKWLRTDAVVRNRGRMSEIKEEIPASLMDMPIDLSRLKELFGQNENEKQVAIKMFMKGIEDNLSVMSMALMSNNGQLWKETAHRIKGAAANFGAHQMQALATQAEDYSNCELNDKQVLLKMMTTAYEDITKYL